MRTLKRWGSVRIDLVGGTLDLLPIALLLPGASTYNLATNLQCEVELREMAGGRLKICAEDLGLEVECTLKEWREGGLAQFPSELELVVRILKEFPLEEMHLGLSVRLASRLPAGSGLGTSSAMGATLYQALAEFFYQKNRDDLSIATAIAVVKDIEAIVLGRGPTGYQDYYPAFYGGILGLTAHPGRIQVEQFYSDDLANFFQSHLLLVYSGASRNSGINNWEVYKSFFDANEQVVEGLKAVAKICSEFGAALKDKNEKRLLELIIQEGELRRSLFHGIYTDEMNQLRQELEQLDPTLGMKVCGAGGGGHFLIVCPDGQLEEARQAIKRSGKGEMKVVPFQVLPPI